MGTQSQARCILLYQQTEWGGDVLSSPMQKKQQISTFFHDNNFLNYSQQTKNIQELPQSDHLYSLQLTNITLYKDLRVHLLRLGRRPMSWLLSFLFLIVLEDLDKEISQEKHIKYTKTKKKDAKLPFYKDSMIVYMGQPSQGTNWKKKAKRMNTCY